jgi:alginate O-acetyltransferase complex protein AlgI
MLFNSLEYVLFLSLVFLGFWGLARARLLRIVLLCLASYLFYMAWNATFIVLIVASTLCDYLIGLALSHVEDALKRKLLLYTSLAFNLGLLGLFKYADFFIAAAAQGLQLFGIEGEPTFLRLVLPVGISFYTFQSLSYTIDVYRRKIEPTRSFWEFATYVAFFPQLVAGPIVRAKEFLPQFHNRPKLSLARANEGVFLIMCGLFKKVVIADYLAANYIDRVFDDPTGFSSAEAWLAVYGYSWQLYGDFSGYTDIARGSAILFGFDLPENFARPWRSTGPIEFWRTWHMTLGRWVQDYVYLPLGGSRRGRARTYLNLFICFFAVGIWHGAGWAYVLFALYQSIGVVLNRIYRDIRGVKGPPEKLGVKMIALNIWCHLFFMGAWSIFRAPSLDHMFDLWHQMFLAHEWASAQLGAWAWVILIGMPIIHFTPRRWVPQLRDGIARLPWPLQTSIVLGVGAIIVWVGSRQPSPFIYFQF